MAFDRKKAIVLYGREKTGKTTTLNYVIANLLSTGTLIAGDGFTKGKDKNEKDRWAIIEYYGVNIAVVTEGDNRDVIEKYFKIINSTNLDIGIYIFATRSKGETIEFIFDNFPNNTIIWEQKWVIEADNYPKVLVEELCDEANEMQAQAIITAIDKI